MYFISSFFFIMYSILLYIIWIRWEEKERELQKKVVDNIRPVTKTCTVYILLTSNTNTNTLLQGLDVFNYVQVKTQLTGSIPTIPLGSKIEMDAFNEEYTKVKPGKVTI